MPPSNSKMIFNSPARREVVVHAVKEYIADLVCLLPGYKPASLLRFHLIAKETPKHIVLQFAERPTLRVIPVSRFVPHSQKFNRFAESPTRRT
jgi:hypothetical protein